MNNISFEELVQYYRNELTPEKQNEIATFLKNHKIYTNVLQGIEQIDKELEKGDTIENFFSKKQEVLKNKIFSEDTDTLFT